MRYKFFNYLLILVSVMFTACGDITDKKTTIEVEDNGRHYYPILAGQEKDLSFNIINTGANPLVITDIITSCGCLKVDEGMGVFTVPPGKERILTLSYNSAKNIGYVKHYITLYGNFEKKEYEELVFDINVVPNAMYTKDYEELHIEDMKSRGGVEELVDGDASNKGYYMNEDLTKSIQGNR